MTHIFDWTPERVAQLHKLWAQGISAPAIAREMGHGAKDHTIRSKAQQQKLPPRVITTAGQTGDRWSADAIETLKKLWNEGLSGREIASRFGTGFTHYAVTSKARHLGLPQRGEARARKGVREGKRKSDEMRAQASVEMAAVSVEAKPRTDFVQGPVVVAFERKVDRARGFDIMELRGCQCRMPLRDRGEDGQYLFCGAKTRPEAKFSFCDEHLDVVLANGHGGRRPAAFREAAE